jgi:ribosomal protein S11
MADDEGEAKAVAGSRGHNKFRQQRDKETANCATMMRSETCNTPLWHKGCKRC